MLALTMTNRMPTLCPFALVTGTACPGCGLTRAFRSLLLGDMSGAIRFHPVVFVVAAWAAAGLVALLLRARGRSLRIRTAAINRLLWATAALFVVTWVVRLATGSLPPV